MEGRVADFSMNLTEGNIFEKRNIRFTFMVCACKFLKRIRKNLLTIDHHEVEFIQKGREIVSRDFFELMPCALEAQTVIKTFCLR